MQDRLIYYREQPIEENNVVELRFEAGPDIEEFKQLCVTMAHFLGYDDETINESFGVSTSSKDYKAETEVRHYKK